MMNPDETYIGDGCFVSFDGWQFCLRAPRERGDHYIYLEPEVLRHFLGYIEALKQGPKEIVIE